MVTKLKKEKPKPTVRDKLELFSDREEELVAGFISRMIDRDYVPEAIGRGVADLMATLDEELYIK